MNYLLSIVIPTRNREEYCKKVVDQVLAATSELTEVVGQDNSDNDVMANDLKGKEISRLIVNHVDGQISFTDNFTAALNLAHGKYVCMIGDDDGVLPCIETIAAFAYNNGIDAVVPGLNAVYIWPSEQPIVKKGENGYLCLSYVQSKVDMIDSKATLINLCNNGFQNYQKLAVPRLYHGLVSQKKLDIFRGGYWRPDSRHIHECWFGFDSG